MSNISKVSFDGNTLIDLTSDTVTASDLLSGKTAHDSSGAIITGTIPSISAATITPSTADQTIAAGNYLSGIQTISGDANLLASNIKDGTSIFGVTGTYYGSAATGTIAGSGNQYLTINTGLNRVVSWFYMYATVSSVSTYHIQSVIKPHASTTSVAWILKNNSSGELISVYYGTITLSSTGVVSLNYANGGQHYFTSSATYTWYAW